jgi:4a-hydroxytetrahydrobiopterin dehydratase
VTRPAKIGAAAALTELPLWSRVEGRDAIRRDYRFASFSAAFGWMTRVALAAEALDHHPEWFNVYNRVTVDLMTHDAQGITQKDVDLATLLEGIAKKLA